MTRGHKPRRQRPGSLDPVLVAKNNATRLTPAEVAEPIACLRVAAKALREGVATEWQWMVVASSLNVAQAIERSGVVRGLSGHLHAAEIAMQAIYRRAMASGTWCSTSLCYQELEDISSMVDLHEFQLGQVSYGESRHAVNLTKARVVSQQNLAGEFA